MLARSLRPLLTVLFRGSGSALPRAAAAAARRAATLPLTKPSGLHTRLASNVARAKTAPGVLRAPLRPLSTPAAPTPTVRAVASSPVDVFGMMAAATALGLCSQSLRVVPAGEIAVEDLFGKVDRQPKTSGLHVKNPLSSFHPFSVKTANIDFSCAVPSNEGLTVEVQFSVQYRLDPAKVVELYETVGDEFVNKIILPQVRAAVRSATAQRDAKALYTSEREQVKADLIRELNNALNPRGVIVEDAPLRAIVLPAKLSQSIESKLQMEQESQRMDFVLQKERQEAERKRIEAQGIADFQNIVSKGIDEKTLRWKGIEATVDLAKSENAKVVVVGSAKDGGLPLILGNTGK